MPRPLGTIGETKLKILAVVYHNELHGANSYGYSVWTKLKERFRCYLDERDLRNVYRHLRDLHSAGLVEKGTKQPTESAAKRRLYTLTHEGKEMKQKFSRYLRILEKDV